MIRKKICILLLLISLISSAILIGCSGKGENTPKTDGTLTSSDTSVPDPGTTSLPTTAGKTEGDPTTATTVRTDGTPTTSDPEGTTAEGTGTNSVTTAGGDPISPTTTPDTGEIEKLPIYSISASSTIFSNLKAENLLDGNPSTFWSSSMRSEYPSSGDSVSLSIDGCAQVSKVELTPRKGIPTAFPRGFKLQYYCSDSGWQDIPGQIYDNLKVPTDALTLEFPAVETEKIRIVGTHYGTDDNGDYLMQFGDISLYGTIIKEREPSPFGESPISEPYEYIFGGSFSGTAEPFSPDPLVAYRWANPTASDGLEIYLKSPETLTATEPKSFSGLDSAVSGKTEIKVTGPGTIVIDFGCELAGWLEIDSADLSGKVTLGVSEYNRDAYVNAGPQSPCKTATPVKYGSTYRLELNSELYEGARFAFIHVETFDKPFTITAVRMVCQVKPVNYEGSFHSDNEMLEKIWYAAAYDVRLNLRSDYFSAILVDRGDRYSWTGDAYTSQAASLVAFANYDSVLQNLRYTSGHSNGIESYELYWVESLIDYYQYSGDAEGTRSLIPEATRRLDHAYAIFDNPQNLGFFGWDERLGSGFENPNCTENQNAYRMVAIGAWKHFAAVLEELGEKELAAKYLQYAKTKTQKITSDPLFYTKLGIHASADAINAGLISDLSLLYHEDFSDRLNRLSYSPFNQYFLLEAMAKAGGYSDAIASILDLWGGQIEYGGTTFFENFRPGWNDIVGTNDPVPNSQCGYTSLAHPWSAGVLSWMNEEILGIKPTSAGFKAFTVTPHMAGYTTQISGTTPTPYGDISVSVDLNTGVVTLIVPEGTTASIGLPKEGRTVNSITQNGKAVSGSREDSSFVYIDNLTEGSYTFKIGYSGKIATAKEESYEYPATFAGEDRETGGKWGSAYGSDGYLLLAANNGADIRSLPDYVASVTLNKGKRTVSSKVAKTAELTAGAGSGKLGVYYSNGNVACDQTFTVDIKLNQKRDYTVILYFADCDGGGREQCVEMFDGNTLNLIAPIAAVRDFEGGVYLVYSYNDSVRFRIDHIRGDNAVLSAIFFGLGGGDPTQTTSEIVDDQSSAVHYTGSWTHDPMGSAYNGTFSYSNIAGNSATLTFEGKYIAFLSSLESNRGIVEILLDGVSQGEFDLYSASTARQQIIFSKNDLSEGSHTIEIRVTGKKNPASSGAYVEVDAFEIR